MRPFPRLILICGVSGTGKSMTAQELERQLRLNGVSCRWLHEECRHNPIRDGEFQAGPLDTREGMARNLGDMYRRWRSLVRRVNRSDSVYILDAVLFENISRYLFPGSVSDDDILDYYRRIEGILGETDSLLIHLHHPDVKTAFTPVFGIRGEWWRDLILTPDAPPRPGTDPSLPPEDAAWALNNDYQVMARRVFDEWSLPKVDHDTSARNWDALHQRLTAYIGIDYHPPQAFPIRGPERYVGRFASGSECLNVRFDGTSLYVESFWPYMQLIPMGASRFVMASFPIRLRFQNETESTFQTVRVSGNYDWDICGQTLNRTA